MRLGRASWRRRLLLTLAVLAGAVVLAVAGLAVYLRFADLSGYRTSVARLLSDAMNRELTISGAFEPRIGIVSRLVATDVTLANPHWCADPQMVRADHLLVELRPASFLFGPVRIDRIELRGVRVALETDERGRASWDFETGRSESRKQAGEDSGEPILEIGSVRIEAATLDYRDPGLPEPLTLDLERLTLEADDRGLLEIEGSGALNGRSLSLTGSLGPLDGLIRGRNVEHDLSARLDELEIDLAGRTERLADLEGVRLDARICGPDAGILGELGVPVPGDGPFEIAIRARPEEGTSGTSVSVSVEHDAVSGEIEGSLDSLLEPTAISARVDASGPDFAVVAAAFGVGGLPSEPFGIGGAVTWAGFPLAVDQLELRVGDDLLRADGILGAPPGMPGTDFGFRVDIRDASWIGRIAGVELPAARLVGGGRVQRRDEGVRIEDVSLELDDISVRADGLLRDIPSLPGTELRVEARGPGVPLIERAIGIELPDGPFELSANAGVVEGGVALSDARLTLGDSSLAVDGVVGTSAGLAGTHVRVRASGPDLSAIGQVIGTPGLPARAFAVEGAVEVDRDAIELHGVRGTVDELALKVDGRVGTGSGLRGTDVSLEAKGEDVSWLAALAGEDRVPGWPYELRGGLHIAEAGYELRRIRVAAGPIEAEIDGLLVPGESSSGSRLEVQASGPALADLDFLLGNGTGLPVEPFRVAGTLGIGDDVWRVEQGVLTVGENRLEIDGTIAPSAGLAGTDVVLRLAGPDLAATARQVAAAGVPGVPRLPDTDFEVAGRIVVSATGYRLEGMRSKVGAGRFALEGTIGPLPDLVGTDLAIDASSDQPVLLEALLGVDLPSGTLRVRGRVERGVDEARFRDLVLDLAGFHARVNGTLGDPPRFVGTNVDIEARGPSLKTLGAALGDERLPDVPFEVAGHFEGDPARFSMPRIEILAGNSRIEGSFRADLRDKPAIAAELHAPRIDLAEWTPGPEETTEPEPPAERDTSRLIPDEPIDLGLLDAADLDLRVAVDKLAGHHLTFSDMTLAVRLRNGHLEIGPASMLGPSGGRFDAALTLEPTSTGPHVRLSTKIENARATLKGSKIAPGEAPPIDVEMTVEGTGVSPRALAASASGSIVGVIGEGAIDKSVIEVLTAGVIEQVLSALNPFRNESRSTTEFECAVLVVSVQQGVARIDPIAARTDTLTLVGGGRIDLSTERIDLHWTLKPRKGVGLSASAITNPYIKLGGTLARPVVEIKPLEAVTSTGVAVATGGLSILGKGLLDRITAEKKVCKQAIRRAERQADERPLDNGGGVE